MTLQLTASTALAESRMRPALAVTAGAR
jgi:hypothetical protein